jgi:dolichol-phosphate mannosyltransferase
LTSLSPKAAVIVPTLNERDNIAPLLAGIDAALNGRDYEVIFVDDWSSDGTPDTIQSIARNRPDVRLLRRFGRKGLSSAVIEGMMATSADIVAVIDADRQHDESLLPHLIDLVASDSADVAVGSRYIDDGSTGDWAAGRVKISQFATSLAKKFLPADVSDPMSGFFAVRRSAVDAALPNLSAAGFKILLDLLVSSPTKLRVAELPYQFRTRVAGESKLDAGVALDFLILLADKTFRKFAPPRLVLFGMVGGIGVAVHLTILRTGLRLFDLDFSAAQALAVTGSIAFNFSLNNAITYRDRRLSGVRWWLGLLSFYLVCGIGAIANVGVGSFVFAQDARWWMAGIAGAAVGSIWNFAASSFVTWRKK